MLYAGDRRTESPEGFGPPRARDPRSVATRPTQISAPNETMPSLRHSLGMRCHPSALSPYPCFAPPCGSVASSPATCPLAWPRGVSCGRLGASPRSSDGIPSGLLVGSALVPPSRATRPIPARFMPRRALAGGVYRKRARIVSSLRHNVWQTFADSEQDAVSMKMSGTIEASGTVSSTPCAVMSWMRHPMDVCSSSAIKPASSPGAVPDGTGAGKVEDGVGKREAGVAPRLHATGATTKSSAPDSLSSKIAIDTISARPQPDIRTTTLHCVIG